jgi:chemosensory pili system protein ChpA (sensor histidine kinase/response regulator)
MVVLEEKFTALETAVAEVVNILFEILAEESPDDEVAALPAKLDRYARQVERIGMAAEAAGFMGLRDLCILFQEKLGELGAQERVLLDDERLLLEEWPTLVVGYLESPDDPATRDGLLQHLSNPVWSTPLAPEDAELMKELFAMQAQEAPWETPSETPPAMFEETESSSAMVPDEGIITPVEEGEPSPTELAEVEALLADDDEVPVEEPETVSDTHAAVSAEEPREELAAEPAQGADTPTSYAMSGATTPPEEAGDATSVALAADDWAETPPAGIAEPVAEESPSVLLDSAEQGTLEPEQFATETPAPTAEAEQQQASEETESAASAWASPFAPTDTTPEAEVARLLDVLESLPAPHDGAPAVVTPDYLARYATQVEHIGLTAGVHDLLGLQDVCLLCKMNLVALVERGEALADTEFESLLATWPTLVMAYLESPSDPAAGQALVEHLRHPAWPTPLAADEAGVLRGVLTPNAPEVEQPIAAEGPVAESAEPMAAYSERDFFPESVFEEATEQVGGEAEAGQAVETAGGEAAEDSESSAFPAGAVNKPVAGLDEGTLAYEALEQARIEETAEEEEEVEAEEEEEAQAVAGGAGGISSELLEILAAEVAQIDESSTDMLAVASAESGDADSRREALTNYAEEIGRLADAAEAVGLGGLHQVCAHVQANILELAVHDRALYDGEQAVIAGWPAVVSAYLSAITDRAACRSLAEYLQDARWPNPLPAEESAPLVEVLAAPTPVAEEMVGETRQESASPEDVSLALPEDVNPELLDSLLQELPSQTAELSAAIQRLAQGEGGLDDVDVAQRIAHTVKGAGNTVGVRGIANLTHHMEDILLAFSKHKTLPTRALSDALLNATDCLENMSEALLGMSAPPPQALAVLQEVLDWANRIDREGIPAEDEQAPPSRKPTAAPAPVQAEEEATAAAAEHAAAPLLRVPATLVDDLLRLVGESIILTGQVQERVRKTMQHARAVQEQNLAFQQLTAELEQLVDVRGISSPLAKVTTGKGDFDPLELEQYNELNTVTHRLLEVANDSQELSQGVEGDLTVLDTLLVDQGRLHRESQEAVLRTRMVPVKTIVPRLQRSVRQTCRLTDKEAELIVKGSDTLIDSNVLNDMTDPLMHILRNAVDHGIELPDVRRANHKEPVGRIELAFFREGNAIVVRCQDDGAGLALPAIRRAAEQKGLITPGKALSDEELSRLILMPGFSTRTEVTQTSGRGIGMDMVYSRIQEIKGSLNIQSKAGQGCTIELRLPVTLISTHALLVRIRDHLYAVSDRGIEQILYSGIGKIHKLGTTTTYQIDDDIYELSSLDELLKLPADRRAGDRSVRPLLLVREESGATRAVLVEDIVDSRDLVVKSMGPYIPKLRGIVGATILGDGSVAPVLDLPDLLRAPVSAYLALPTAAGAEAGVKAEAKRRYALVVDDSLSARRALAQFVEDAGFEVRTAKDGMEAAEIIDAKEPDILLVDLEMPRMNGLELTSHVRARTATHDLPIIMITSRSTAKHVHEAEVAGVNYYLTKPFSEDELLGRINQLLSRK